MSLFGFELVLNATVPQMGEEVDVPGKFTTELARAFWSWVRAHDPGEGGEGGQVIAQEIPEFQVRPQVVRWRVQQRTVRFADAPVPQATSLERISERIQEQIADAPKLQGISQERISERIVEQTVDFPLQGIA